MLVTQSEFARLAKVSRSAVCQAVKAGLITATETREGKVYINKDEGLKQYENNSRKRNKPKPVPVTLPAATGLDMLSWGSAPSAAAQEAPAEPTQPTPSRPANDSEVPSFNDERARHEREKRMLAKLARQEKEGELLRRDDVTAAWQNAVNLTRTKLLGVPSTAKARIPHLEHEEVEVLTLLIREALEELAAGEVAS